MRKPIFIRLLIVSQFFINCSDSQLIEQWKNPDVDSFSAEKVLVVAISNDQQSAKIFEDRLVEQLQNRGINAFVSTSFFKNGVPEEPVSENDKQKLEQELFHAGYDAVLVSKVIGAQNKTVLLESRQDITKPFDSFGADYYYSQDLYRKEDRIENYTVYHAQSIVYCICPDSKSKTIWRASIDVNQLDTKKKAINDYIKLLTKTLHDQYILISD